MEVNYIMTERFETPDRGIEYIIAVVSADDDTVLSGKYKQSNGFYLLDMIEKLLNDNGLGHLSVQVTATSGPYQVYRVTK